jgi:hypothetical protein
VFGSLPDQSCFAFVLEPEALVIAVKTVRMLSYKNFVRQSAKEKERVLVGEPLTISF